MSISYTLLITPSQADSYMNDGIDLCGGFAIVSSDIASVVRVEDFISLFHGTIDGSPFSPDRPVDILEIPADPFVQARHAVGPLDPRAVLGGIIELPPFDGTGRVQTALTSADLLWIEPTRIPIGSQLKRYYPGRPEPQHVATYHGVAWGWQAEATQSFSAFIPSPFIGATIQRDWGDVPVDVEYGDDGSIVALTLISPTEPKMEQGFEKIESGMWAKRIAYRPGMEVREKHMVGRVGNIPVRILRTMRDEDGELFAFCVSLLLDMPLVLASGFVRWGQAYAVTTVPFVSVKPSVQYVPYVPLADDVPVRVLPPAQKDMDRAVQGIYLLYSAVAPEGWREGAVLVQMVNHKVVSAGVAVIPDENGDPQKKAVHPLPHALYSYALYIKEQTIDEKAGGAVSVRFDFTSTSTKVNIQMNYMDEPEFADDVPLEDWKAEIAEYPRDAAYMPQWLLRRAGMV